MACRNVSTASVDLIITVTVRHTASEIPCINVPIIISIFPEHSFHNGSHHISRSWGWHGGKERELWNLIDAFLKLHKLILASDLLLADLPVERKILASQAQASLLLLELETAIVQVGSGEEGNILPLPKQRIRTVRKVAVLQRCCYSDAFRSINCLILHCLLCLINFSFCDNSGGLLLWSNCLGKVTVILTVSEDRLK